MTTTTRDMQRMEIARQYFDYNPEERLLYFENQLINIKPYLRQLQKDVKEIKGMVVNKGCAKGRVKIVLTPDDINKINLGPIGGFGYKLKKGKGLTVGVKYYYSMLDVYKNIENTRDSSIFLKVNIPIGAGQKKTEVEPSIDETEKE